MQARWISEMDPSKQEQLRKNLENISEPAAVTVEWAVETHWGRLCWIADYYENSTILNENWKDAEKQWEVVQQKVLDLQEAFTNLGELACAIPRAKAFDPDVLKTVRPFLPRVPGEPPESPLIPLEWFAGAAVKACEEMKKQCNGAQRGAGHGRIDFMFSLIFQLFKECPKYPPKNHAQPIALVIHEWATGETIPEEKRDRWGEHSMNRVPIPG